jgi:hypothetical protein
VNIGETARILAKAQLVDNRQITELVIKEWHEVIGHLFYEDAYNAVTEHRRTSTEYLLPGHVVAGARRAREARERASRQQALPVGNTITFPGLEWWHTAVVAAIEQHRGTP